VRDAKTRIYVLGVFLATATYILLDFLAPFIWVFGLESLNSCQHVVIDVYGVLNGTPLAQDRCYKAGLSLDELRALGMVGARRIIIVTHFFSSGNTYGLGTSDPVEIWTPLLHPLTAFFLVKGVTPDGGMYLAATPALLKISSRYDGKEVVLITCHRHGIESLVESFQGAEVVVVTASDVGEAEALPLVYLALKVENARELCGKGVFVCV